MTLRPISLCLKLILFQLTSPGKEAMDLTCAVPTMPAATHLIPLKLGAPGSSPRCCRASTGFSGAAQPGPGELASSLVDSGNTRSTTLTNNARA